MDRKWCQKLFAWLWSISNSVSCRRKVDVLRYIVYHIMDQKIRTRLILIMREKYSLKFLELFYLFVKSLTLTEESLSWNKLWSHNLFITRKMNNIYWSFTLFTNNFRHQRRPLKSLLWLYTKPLILFLTRWVVEPWNKCSVTCGGGVKERRVYCQQGRNDSKVPFV